MDEKPPQYVLDFIESKGFREKTSTLQWQKRNWGWERTILRSRGDGLSDVYLIQVWNDKPSFFNIEVLEIVESHHIDKQ